MLPHTERIRRVQFQYILSRGKRYNSPHLLLYIALKNTPTEKNINNFAFSVSKKIAKRAVVRNKLRRQGYNIISKYKNKITHSHFFLFCFKKDSTNLSFSHFEKEILELLQDASVLL